MRKVKVVIAEGFDVNEVFEGKADFQLIGNATQAWKKAGEPKLTVELESFAANYLQTKVKSVAGSGYYVVLDAPTKDTREKPYKVDNIVNEGERKYKTFYIPVDPKTGAPATEERPETKAEGVNLAKKLVTELKKDIVVNVVREVVEGEAVAAYVSYTPSVNAKAGRFIYFGIEK